MEYKALMLDVDGTIVPYDYEALPSPRVTEAIKKAAEKVTVCITTGRSLSFLQPILDHLEISGLAIINNGAQVLHTKTRQIYYERLIEPEVMVKLYHLLLKENIPFYIKDAEEEIFVGTTGGEYTPRKTLNIFTEEIFEPARIETLIHHLSQFSTLTVQPTTHREQGKVGLLISHAEATKQHGIKEVLKILNLSSSEIMGVGDGYNDFPLLMACGLKIAMGNAVEDLKQIADDIAPHVDDDGAAQVIEKYILS